MIEISLCMIVKNEERYLDNCLRSVHDLVDEIIIVDTGSTDRTKEIAACYTNKIYDFAWIDDFAAARNFSFSKATKDYCMWLDADDILTEDSRNAFRVMKQNFQSDDNVILMPYHCAFTEDGRLRRILIRERIVKRSAGFQWQGEIHESLAFPEGFSGTLISDVAVTHTKEHGDSERNFRIVESAFKAGNTSLKTLYYYAVELSARDRDEEAIAIFERFFAYGGHETSQCLEACIHLHNLYLHTKQYDKALKISMDCLPQCLERSEFCCQLGSFYMHMYKDLSEAAYWFDRAAQCPYPELLSFSIMQEYYYYAPYLQLGKVYFLQGLYQKGLECFRKALQYYPESPELRALIDKATKLLAQNSQ